MYNLMTWYMYLQNYHNKYPSFFLMMRTLRHILSNFQIYSIFIFTVYIFTVYITVVYILLLTIVTVFSLSNWEVKRMRWWECHNISYCYYYQSKFISEVDLNGKLEKFWVKQRHVSYLLQKKKPFEQGKLVWWSFFPGVWLYQLRTLHITEHALRWGLNQ